MVVETFTKRLLNSGIFEAYTAAVFFGTTIFFVINSNHYTPLEMIFWIVMATIIFKGIANIMLSMTISLVSLNNQQDKVEFEKSSTKLESLVNDLSIQEAAIQSTKTNNSN